MGDSKCAHRVLMERSEGNKPLGRLKRLYKNNIKMEIKEVGLETMEWIALAPDRERWRALVNTVTNLRVP
jgi:hypothetical protein